MPRSFRAFVRAAVRIFLRPRPAPVRPRRRSGVAGSGRRIEIAGQVYRGLVRSTLGHDLWLMRQARRAGLHELTLEPDETPTQFAARLLGQLLGSRQALLLLGATMVPDAIADLSWTPKRARATAAFLASLDAEEDKAQIRALIVEVLLPFLENELISLRRSVRSSTSPTSAPDVGSANGSTPEPATPWAPSPAAMGSGPG